MPNQTTTVSSKGQTVVPASIRKELGIHEGTILAWDVKNGKIILTPAVNVTPEDPFATFNEWSSKADEDAYANL